MVQEFLAWAEKENWNIKMREEPLTLPDEIQKRYRIPAEWLAFIEHFSLCASGDCSKWFITFEDYHNDSGYLWNEFEQISLGAAADDAEWSGNIKEFWDRHLPIYMSVGGDYEYYAIDTENGNVVQGWEPEFEEAEVVADTFEDFIRKVISDEILL